MISYYYWRMQKDGELCGPTFGPCDSEKTAINQIMKIMKIDKLPPDFQLILPVYNPRIDHSKTGIAILVDIHSIKDEVGLLTDKNTNFLKESLADFPSISKISKITTSGIWPEIGYLIPVGVSCHSARYESSNVIYDLDDPQQLKNFTDALEKRILDRIRRQEKNKNVKRRTTFVGQFKHDPRNTIERAKFSIYLDRDNLTEANPYVVGTIKFYRKATQNVMFDIDKKKIWSRDGKKEIKADNTDQIINNLIECLASTKG